MFCICYQLVLTFDLNSWRDLCSVDTLGLFCFVFQLRRYEVVSEKRRREVEYKEGEKMELKRVLLLASGSLFSDNNSYSVISKLRFYKSKCTQKQSRNTFVDFLTFVFVVSRSEMFCTLTMHDRYNTVETRRTVEEKGREFISPEESRKSTQVGRYMCTRAVLSNG